mgnify:CR=1 FL=1
MTEYIKAAGGHYTGGQTVSYIGVDQGLGGAQVLMCNPRFGMQGLIIKDGDAGDFAAGARCGRAGDMWLKRAGYGFAIADRRIDVGIKIRRVTGI